MADRLLVDLGEDGQAGVLSWPDGGLPELVSRAPLAWPLDAQALEDLRWYLEDYLLAPFGVWEDRGPVVQAMLARWGNQVFGSVFGAGPARFAYERARDRGLEVVFRSAEPGLLGLPWELMRDGSGPVAMTAGGISRSLPVAGGAGTLEVPGGRLRVLMVISRPAGTGDVGYQVVARPLLERLDAVRGEVDLTVLRPPSFNALCQAVRQAADAGVPFHVVHFDGHGMMPGRAEGGVAVRPAMMAGPGEGVLAFERPGGGGDHVGASKVAAALAEGRVPVVVLNACQSGAVGKELEASVATALLQAGCAAVVAMAYSVYAVAAAEFMAAFYESVFTGASVGQAVGAGRRQLFEHDGRPSPKGEMPLADWLVPVHYIRKEVRFPQARTGRRAGALSLDAVLDQIRAATAGPATAHDPLAAVGAFVGRDDLLYQLESAARLQRVVVLAGPGGTGKTELAKGFARWWRDTGGVDDPRLVLWHSFEPGVASFGLDGVISGIGLAVFGADFARLDPPQRLAQVKQLLEQSRVLLVWDNFESVREMPDPATATLPLDDAGCAALKGFLEWMRDHSSSVVIITSRAREGWLGQVRRIGVGGLNQAEAAQYAGYLLAPFPAARERRQRRSFGALLEWLDGHPLALRLTLPSLDTANPADLLAGLQATTPLATEDAGPGRLSSLGACITYSFAHLSEQTRRLLPAVSLFHTVADARALGIFSRVPGVPKRFRGAGRYEWAAALDDAARVGLLSRLGAGIYRIHPALPGYLATAWRRDEPANHDAVREAAIRALLSAHAVLGSWMRHQIHSGDARSAYAAIGLERRTLSNLLGYALGHGLWDDAQRIAEPLSQYWDARGLDDEAAAWADRARQGTEAPDGTPPQLDTDAGALWLFFTAYQASRKLRTGHLDDADRTYQQVLNTLHAQPTSPLQQRHRATVYHQLGMIARDQGRLDEAEDLYRKSLGINEQIGDRHGMAATYHVLGSVGCMRGRLDEAEGWYRKSLAINEQLGNRPGMAGSYQGLGTVAHLGGQLDEAEDLYRKSSGINEQLGDRPGMADIYHQLGSVTQNRGRLDEAEGWYRKSLAINEQLGIKPRTAMSYHNLGIVAEHRGQLDEAEEWYRKSLAIKQELGDRPGMAGTYHQLGSVAQDRGRLDEAEGWYRKSLPIKEELGDQRSMALSYGQLGLLAEQRGQPQQAMEWTVRCVSLFSEFPHPMTGPAPFHLARLTKLLGMPALEHSWHQMAGHPVPQAVRDYITSHHEEQPGGGP